MNICSPVDRSAEAALECYSRAWLIAIGLSQHEVTRPQEWLRLVAERPGHGPAVPTRQPAEHGPAPLGTWGCPACTPSASSARPTRGCPSRSRGRPPAGTPAARRRRPGAAGCTRPTSPSRYQSLRPAHNAAGSPRLPPAVRESSALAGGVPPYGVSDLRRVAVNGLGSDYAVSRAGAATSFGVLAGGASSATEPLEQVAAFADLPFVVGFDQHGVGQPEQGLGVGEDPATSVGA
jgi:hypothetical protein